MKEYHREYPQFSLCGLNCGLCPRYHTDGPSRCPGCGGEEFHLKHPTCAIITCNQKKKGVQFCYQCPEYPCERYRSENKKDSFISYQHVIRDMEKARQQGIEAYQKELSAKMEILDQLLTEYDDGRHKGYFCMAVNLLEVDDLRKILIRVDKSSQKTDDKKMRAAAMEEQMERTAQKNNITLRLRK